MKHYLLLACSGICIAAQAVEYGSITLPQQEIQADAVVHDYAARLCEKRAAMPNVLLSLGNEEKTGHIVCVAGDRRAGDIFTQMDAGGLHINYRLD